MQKSSGAKIPSLINARVAEAATMGRYELTEQSRQSLAGEYIPSAVQQQPVINVHVHNHTGSAKPSSMAMSIIKIATFVAAGYVGVMYMQGYAPSEAFGIVQSRVAPVVPEIRSTASDLIIQAREVVGLPEPVDAHVVPAK
jgi:hypothetical protein